MNTMKTQNCNIDYITAKEAADNWGISRREVQYLCTRGRIEGAIKVGIMWLIPKDTKKPTDKRRRGCNEEKQ